MNTGSPPWREAKNVYLLIKRTDQQVKTWAEYCICFIRCTVHNFDVKNGELALDKSGSFGGAMNKFKPNLCSIRHPCLNT